MPRTLSRVVSAAALTAACVAPWLAHAAAVAGFTAASPDCSVSANPLQCRLTGILHLLYAAAAVLAVVLIIALVFAIRMYRRNRDGSSKGPHA